MTVMGKMSSDGEMFTNVHLPLKCLPVAQDALDLLPAARLVLGVQCQAVQEPGDPAGRRVMPLEHERVHLSTQVLIRQASSILVLAAQRELQWPPRRGHCNLSAIDA